MESSQVEARTVSVRIRLEQACSDLRCVLEEMGGQEQHAAKEHVFGLVRQQLAAAEQALEALDRAQERT